MGVRYVLEGSVRKAGSRVRIIAEIADQAYRHYITRATRAAEIDGDYSGHLRRPHILITTSSISLAAEHDPFRPQ